MLNDPDAFEVGGHRYRITGKLNAIQQLHVVRRLAPLIGAFVGVDLGALRPDAPETAELQAARSAAMIDLIGPLADGVAKLSDQDTEYVLGACMGLVERDVGGGAGWAPTWSRAAKVMQYEDIGFVELVQIMGRVLMANVGDFGSALSRGGAPAAALAAR